MNLELMLYLADIMTNMHFVFGGFFILSVLFLSGTILSSLEENSPAFFKKYFFKALFIASINTIIYLSIPTQKTIYMIIGIHAAKDIIERPEVKAISGRVFSILNQKLDEIEEIPNKKEKRNEK